MLNRAYAFVQTGVLLCLTAGPALAGIPTPPSNSVPEPATLGILGAGLVAVLAFRRSRRK
jgi:hypothetical protein